MLSEKIRRGLEEGWVELALEKVGRASSSTQ